MYELRVEYGVAPPGDDRPVHLWHFVQDDTAPVALCGHALSPDAPRLPLAEWEQVASWGCRTCHDAYPEALSPRA